MPRKEVLKLHKSKRRRWIVAVAAVLLSASPSFAFVFGEPLPPLPTNPGNPNPTPNPTPPGGGEPTPPTDVIPPDVPLPPPLTNLGPPDANSLISPDNPPLDEFSPGGVKAAPEPATLAMCLAGLGSIGAIAGWRRRRRKPT